MYTPELGQPDYRNVPGLVVTAILNFSSPLIDITGVIQTDYPVTDVKATGLNRNQLLGSAEFNVKHNENRIVDEVCFLSSMRTIALIRQLFVTLKPDDDIKAAECVYRVGFYHIYYLQIEFKHIRLYIVDNPLISEGVILDKKTIYCMTGQKKLTPVIENIDTIDLFSV